jgi:hypothetical protein
MVIVLGENGVVFIVSGRCLEVRRVGPERILSEFPVAGEEVDGFEALVLEAFVGEQSPRRHANLLFRVIRQQFELNRVKPSAH